MELQNIRAETKKLYNPDTKRYERKRLLLYDSIITNEGDGNFELRGQRPPDSTTMMVTQRIFDNAGGYRDVLTVAVMFFGKDGHDHWHVQDLQDFELFRLDNGKLVGQAAKRGFCFFDNYKDGVR